MQARESIVSHSFMWYNHCVPNNELISIVIPIYNEEKNLPALFERLGEVLPTLGRPYEVIMVDDGSRDASFEKIEALAKEGRPVVAIQFKRNFGQTAALAAGINQARGGIIVTLDSDLENDPRDIPPLLAKMQEGYGVVSGWRKNRWGGSFLTRKLPSVTANWLISRLSGVPLHDYGCTLKAYRADLIKGVQLYGEMHRFIAAYAAWQGGRVAEIPVSYQPRLHGKSNYGFSRTFRVLLDLVVIVFMHRYFDRPMHFFGGWGFASLAVGGVAGFFAVLVKIFHLEHIIESLPIIAALFIMVGVQLILFGVMAEILMRTYYESQDKRPYVVKKTIGTVE
jgi:glycosyltransferase involved in cell wall biosynthesis